MGFYSLVFVVKYRYNGIGVHYLIMPIIELCMHVSTITVIALSCQMYVRVERITYCPFTILRNRYRLSPLDFFVFQTSYRYCCKSNSGLQKKAPFSIHHCSKNCGHLRRTTCSNILTS